MNVRLNRRRVAIAATAAFVASALGYGATVDAGLSPAQALQQAAGITEPYTAVDDYVDTLIWWHNHPGWSV